MAFSLQDITGRPQSVTTDKNYTPNPFTQSVANQVLGQWQNLPGPGSVPLQGVAGWDPYQTAAYGATPGALGAAQPYFNAGNSYINQSTQAPDTQSYLNPYANYAYSNWKNYVADPYMTNQGGVDVNAAGGQGASRLALARDNETNNLTQQFGGLMQQQWNSAAAQAAQQRQLQQSAGALSYGVAPTVQQTGFADLGQLFGTGAAAQGQLQNILNAYYQQQQGQYQNPFLRLQAGQGLLGTIAGAMGGNQTGSTTYPAPNPWSSVPGLAMLGMGAMSGNPGTTGNTSFIPPGTNMGAAPGAGPNWTNPDTGWRGGRMLASGGTADDIYIGPNSPFRDIPLRPQQKQQGQSGMPGMDIGNIAKFGSNLFSGAGKLFSGIGSGIGEAGTATGEAMGEAGAGIGTAAVAATAGLGGTDLAATGALALAHRGGRMFADGGMPFDERWGPVEDALASGEFDPQGKAGAPPSPLASRGTSNPFSNPWQDPGLHLPETTSDRVRGMTSFAPQDDDPMTARAEDTEISAPNNQMPPPIANIPTPPNRNFPFNQGNPWLAGGARALMMAGQRDAHGLPMGNGMLGPLGAGLTGAQDFAEKQHQQAREDYKAEMETRKLLEEATRWRMPYAGMTAAQRGAQSISQQTLDRDRYHAPIVSPFADWAVSMPKNPSIDKPVYTPLSPDGTPDTTKPPTTEPPPAKTSVAPANGKLVSEDPETMLTPPDVSKAATRHPDIGQLYYDPRSRPAGYAETKKTAEDLSKANENANVLDTRAKNMRHNLDIIAEFVKNQGNPAWARKLLEPGITGAERQKIINSASYFGVKSIPPEVVAAVNSLGKDSVLGGFRNITSEGLSAREAMPIINAAMGAMPSFGIPEQSSRVLLASMEQAAQRQRDRQAFFNDFRKKNGNFTTGWETEFNQQFPPERYVAHAIYSVIPEDKRRELPEATKQLRAARDDLIAAEKSGDKAAVEAARAKFNTGKIYVDRNYGGLGNYLAFGKM